jgi:hypothetical protein
MFERLVVPAELLRQAREGAAQRARQAGLHLQGLLQSKHLRTEHTNTPTQQCSNSNVAAA